MHPNELFEQFLQQFNATFGPGTTAISEELRQHLRAAMQTAFNKLDLVPREEFDAQQAVLLRTRERLEALEKQVAALEAQLKPS